MTEQLPISPALAEIDGTFNLYGQQIQHTQTQLQSMQEERLRIQGRYAQREADEVEINDLTAQVSHLTQRLAEEGQEIDRLKALLPQDATDVQNPPPEPAGDTSPPEPPQPAADAATGAPS